MTSHHRWVYLQQDKKGEGPSVMSVTLKTGTSLSFPFIETFFFSPVINIQNEWRGLTCRHVLLAGLSRAHTVPQAHEVKFEIAEMKNPRKYAGSE